MHRALFPGVGGDRRGFWEQTAAPARTGDAYSGSETSPFVVLIPHSVFQQHFRPRRHLSAPAQQERQLALHLPSHTLAPTPQADKRRSTAAAGLRITGGQL